MTAFLQQKKHAEIQNLEHQLLKYLHFKALMVVASQNTRFWPKKRK